MEFKKEFGMIICQSSGVESAYSSTYDRRIGVIVPEIMSVLDESFIGEEPEYEFKIVPMDEPDIYIPEKEKPWQNRRKNNYKAKRRK